MDFTLILIEISATLLETFGVGTIVVTSLYNILFFLFFFHKKLPGDLFYKSLRHRLGHGILLGLELLVAADIIRSVAIKPSFDSVIILAGIVLIRTFLSFTLEVEISGKWPWQSKNENKQDKSL